MTTENVNTKIQKDFTLSSYEGGKNAMKITKVTKTYFETEGQRVYFKELQEMMDEHEKFILGEIQNMRKEKV